MGSEIITRIGLLDHMGYGNLGDAAIQEAVIANIKKRLPDARLVGFSFIPDDTIKRHGIPCYPSWWSYPRPEKAGIPTAEKKKSLKSILKSVLKKNPLIYRCAKAVSDFA